MVNIIDGKKIAQNISNKLKDKITRLDSRPGLAAMLVGQDPASRLYVSLKEKAAKYIGISFEKYLLPSSTPQVDVIRLIKSLNQTKRINGILVQLPLPKKFNTQKVIDAISRKKDVDGFRNHSWPDTCQAKDTQSCCLITPPTLAGIVELIKYTKLNVKNKQVCILANSQVFSRPLADLLRQNGLPATSLIIKRKTPTIVEQIKKADIVIIAIGRPNFLTAKDIKKGSTIIDVGINRVGKQVVGDVDFKSVVQKAGWVSPVPGGVGPMTVACLMENVYRLYLQQSSR